MYSYTWDTTNTTLLTVTRDVSNNIKSYKNGIQATSDNIEGDFRVTQVGQRGNLSRFYEGTMGSILFYNRALSQQEILQNHNALKSRFNLP